MVYRGNVRPASVTGSFEEVILINRTSGVGSIPDPRRQETAFMSPYVAHPQRTLDKFRFLSPEQGFQASPNSGNTSIG